MTGSPERSKWESPPAQAASISLHYLMVSEYLASSPAPSQARRLIFENIVLITCINMLHSITKPFSLQVPKRTRCSLSSELSPLPSCYYPSHAVPCCLNTTNLTLLSSFPIRSLNERLLPFISISVHMPPPWKSSFQ